MIKFVEITDILHTTVNYTARTFFIYGNNTVGFIKIAHKFDPRFVIEF